jgi:hypothetical protein
VGSVGGQNASPFIAAERAAELGRAAAASERNEDFGTRNLGRLTDHLVSISCPSRSYFIRLLSRCSDLQSPDGLSPCVITFLRF